MDRSIDPWMRDSVSDDKNACRKVKRILSTQTGLDTEMYYANTQVPSTAAIESDEELLEDADPINSHYSQHNVDCRAKRVKAKVSKLQAEVRENKKKRYNMQKRNWLKLSWISLKQTSFVHS